MTVVELLKFDSMNGVTCFHLLPITVPPYVGRRCIFISLRLAMRERDLAIGGVSVRPSVCLSHASIDSKLKMFVILSDCTVTHRTHLRMSIKHASHGKGVTL